MAAARRDAWCPPVPGLAGEARARARPHRRARPRPPTAGPPMPGRPRPPPQEGGVQLLGRLPLADRHGHRPATGRAGGRLTECCAQVSLARAATPAARPSPRSGHASADTVALPRVPDPDATAVHRPVVSVTTARTFSRVEPGGGSTSWRGRRGRRHRLLAGRPGSSPTRTDSAAPKRPPAQQAATVARCATWTTPPAVVTAVLACPGMAPAGPQRQRPKRDGPPGQPGYRHAMPGPGRATSPPPDAATPAIPAALGPLPDETDITREHRSPAWSCT